MNPRLILAIAVLLAALAVSGCCVCCIPCGGTGHARTAGESPVPGATDYHASARPSLVNVSRDIVPNP